MSTAKCHSQVVSRFAVGQDKINPFEYLRRYTLNGSYGRNELAKKGQTHRINHFDVNLYHYAASFWSPFDLDLDVDHVWCKYLGRAWKTNNTRKNHFYLVLVQEPEFTYTHWKAWCTMKSAVCTYINTNAVIEEMLPARVDVWDLKEGTFEVDSQDELVYK